MNLKLNLFYNEAENLFMQILYDSYENTYFCYLEDHRLYALDSKRWAFKREDIRANEALLDAYETIADHFSARGEGAAQLKAIRTRLECKPAIAHGMSQSGRLARRSAEG